METLLRNLTVLHDVLRKMKSDVEMISTDYVVRKCSKQKMIYIESLRD